MHNVAGGKREKPYCSVRSAGLPRDSYEKPEKGRKR